MDTICCIELHRPPDKAMCDALILAGAHHNDLLTDWSVDLEDLEQIQQFLLSKGIKFDLFFEYLPNENDDIDELAAYLPLDPVTSSISTTSDQLLLLRDEQTSTIVASMRLTEMMAPITNCLSWKTVEQQPNLMRLIEAPELPEPIIINNPLWTSQAEDGSWAVRSDGREIITDKSLAVVRDAGIAQTSKCDIGGKILPWRRPAIFSGQVLQFLLANHVDGIAEPPIYLATSS